MIPFSFLSGGSELFFGGTPSYWFRIDAATASTDTNTKNTVLAAGNFRRLWNFGKRVNSTYDATGNLAATSNFGLWVGATPSYYKGNGSTNGRVFGAPNPDYNNNTFFLVCRITSTPSTTYDILNLNNNALGTYIGVAAYRNAADNGGVIVWGVGNNLQNSKTTIKGTQSYLNSTTLISCYTNPSGSNVRINKNDITTNVSVAGGLAANNFVINATSDNANVNIMEIVYYDGTELNIDDIQKWENYLYDKWV